MKVRLGVLILLVPALLSGLWIGRAIASPDVVEAAPGLINYQGFVSTAGGQAFNGTANMTFELFDAANGGSMLWNETQPSVTVNDGYFSVLLGSVNPIGTDKFSGGTRYLQVKVDPGNGSVMLPRQRLASVPYALQANKASQADNATNATNAVNANQAASAGLASSAPWSGLTGVPAGFADGIDDGNTYAQVVTVAKSGAQFTSIQSALDSIGDASSSKRYLVWIGPGEYNEQVTMKEYVDLQGSGEEMTIIQSAGFGSNNTGTLIGASYAEARFLQVLNTGGSVYALGIYNLNASARFVHVRVRVYGATSSNYGVYLSAFTPEFRDVSIYVACTSSVNCIGLQNIGSNAQISDTSIKVSHSGTGFTYGVNSSGGSMILNDVSIEASTPSSAAAGNMFGFLQQSGAPTLTDVSIVISGLNNAFGIYQSGNLATVQGSSIRVGSSAGTQTGIYYSGSAGNVFKITDSEIIAATNTINNPSGSATMGIFSTHLSGGPVTGAGTEICAGVSNENFTFFSNTCP